MKNAFCYFGLLICFAMVPVLVGCSGKSADEILAESNQTNIQRIRNCYNMYLAEHGWMGPENEAEFKAYLQKASPEVLGRMGIDVNDIDQLFISERDEQPFQIRYEVQSGPRGSDAPVIFESVGVGGNRMVAFLNMQQEEVDGSKFDDLWQGSGAQ